MTANERAERDSAILFARLDGISIKVLADRHNMGVSNVRYILKKQGLGRANIMRDRRESVISLLGQGHSRKEVAVRLGLDIQGVNYIATCGGYEWKPTELACRLCGKLFIQNFHSRAYCSPECYSISNAINSALPKRRVKVCGWCEKPYRVWRHHVKAQRFCSRSCAQHWIHRGKVLRNKEIWYLREIQGLTFVRIGEIFGVSRETARVQYIAEHIRRQL